MLARLMPSLLMFVFAAAAQAVSLSVDKTIPGFASPESVVVAGDDVFVSNMGSKPEPFAKDGDGFISRLDRQGNIKAQRWVDRLNAPKGLMVLQGVVYVVDIDRILGFRVRDGKQVFVLDLSATGGKLFNAFARVDDRHILVSATDLNKVFSIDLGGRKYSELAFDVPPKGPNGLKVTGNHLIVVEWGTDNQANGSIMTYRLQGKSAKLEQQFEPSPPGYFDGVVDLGANRWLISNWVRFEPAGLLQVLDTRTGQVSVANPKTPIAGPADICLDDRGKLWVPGMLAGKVYRMSVHY